MTVPAPGSVAGSAPLLEGPVAEEAAQHGKQQEQQAYPENEPEEAAEMRTAISVPIP